MLLRELFEAQARKIVAVMPGGFHPFHPGHKSLYDWAVKTFGQSNVYVAATNDTASRPFPFEVKKKLAAMAGVPESNFIQVKSPFNNREYANLVDADTALVFVRSQKDKAEQPLPDQTKKNGEPGYLRTYTGKDLNTADEMGYMAYGPTINFDFSGMQIKSASELRATWPEMSDEDKLKAAKLMYGNGAPVAVKLLNQALGDPEAPVGEDASPEEEDEFHRMLDKLVHKTFGHSSDEKKMKKKKTDEKIDTSRASKIDLRNAIATLEPRQQEVIKMRFEHNMTFAAIGKELGVNAERARQILERILRQLRHTSRGVTEPEDISKITANLDAAFKGQKETNEIMGFATRSPKRTTRTVKRRPPEEDSVQDKIKKRRAMASKVGVDKAFSSSANELEKYFGKQ